MTKPDANSYIDWDGIRALPPSDALSVLGQLTDLKDNPFTAERLRLVGEIVREEIARHHPGAQARAAKTLGLSPGRLGQLYDRYKREAMVEIANVSSNYELLNETEDRFDSRQDAHDAIQVYLSQIIDIDGEDEVIMDRKPLKNASGRAIGQTLWVTPDAADAIREAIAASESE